MVSKNEKQKKQKQKQKTEQNKMVGPDLFGGGPVNNILRGPCQQLLTLLTLKSATDALVPIYLENTEVYKVGLFGCVWFSVFFFLHVFLHVTCRFT